MRLNHFSISVRIQCVCVCVCMCGHIDAFIEVRKPKYEKYESKRRKVEMKMRAFERVEHPLIII